TQGSEQASATTQPAGPTAEAQFDTLETAFLDATNQSLDKQPIDDLLQRYTELSKNTDLPISMQRIVEMRLGTLKLRADARAEHVRERRPEQGRHDRDGAGAPPHAPAQGADREHQGELIGSRSRLRNARRRTFRSVASLI